MLYIVASCTWVITLWNYACDFEDLRESVENFGIPFTVIIKTIKLKLMLKLMKWCKVISSCTLHADFKRRFCCKMKIINIHHSFLPAFVGANRKPMKKVWSWLVRQLTMWPRPRPDYWARRWTCKPRFEQLRELGEDVERNVLARDGT